jgi:hypothetical protein
MWLGARNRSSALPQFPLSAHASGRYLVTPQGIPRPVLGRAVWGIIGRTVSEYQSVLDDTVSKGFNAIELQIPNKDPLQYQIPFANNGTLLPFLKTLAGSNWSGTLSYGGDTEVPDFTTPNESYWSYVDTFLDYCAQKNLLVILACCYNGWDGATGAANAGWMHEMVPNGATKMQTYGAFIGNRFAARKNILWLLAGDYGAGIEAYTTAEAAVMDAYTTGLTGVTKQANLYSADPALEHISTDITATGTRAAINVCGGYSFNSGTITQQCRAAWDTGLPSILLECPYDQEGSDGTNANPAATQPCRRFVWWGWLSAVGGFIHGNGYIWPFQPGYSSHLSTTGTLDIQRLNGFIGSIPWQRLIPDGKTGVGTLVTAGGGTIDTTNSVVAAATTVGDLLVAYVSHAHTGSVTIDMTKMRGSTTASWFDPTNATYTAIGTISNSGTHAFTTPGNNSAGEGDWVLRLDA